jgi:hypothetical protein
MYRSIFFSFSALLFAVTTGGTALAGELPNVYPDASVLTSPVSFEIEADPASVSNGLKPNALEIQNANQPEQSSEEIVRRALRAYDRSVKDDPFGIKSKPVYGPPLNVSGSPKLKQKEFRFDRNDSYSYSYSYPNPNPKGNDFNSYDSDRFSSDARRQIATQRQRAADRIADMISPGFGRAEFEIGENHVRIDYIYSRRCKTRGVGVCFQMTFR